MFSHSPQGARASGHPSPKLLPLGCLHTKLQSPPPAFAHSDHYLGQRPLFPKWCPRHRSPNSEVVRTRRVLRGHPVNSSERGPRELSPAPNIFSDAPVFSLLHLGLLPLKMRAPRGLREYAPLSAHRAGDRGDSGMEQGEDMITTVTTILVPYLMALHSLSPSSHWILIAPLGGRQDRGYLKDEKKERLRSMSKVSGIAGI